MTALFQPEVDSLDAQLAALQAQIAAVQEQRTAITKAESVATGIVQAVAAGIEEFQQISGIGADAIARLKSAVLDIFQGDNNPDDGGNFPLEPAPQPNDDGGSEVVVELEQDSSTVDTQPADQEQVAIAVNPEPLTGQSCEWASPWASPLASPLATPLCCHLEDAPLSVLKGQSVEIACVVSDAPKKPEYIELVPVGHTVAYQQKTSTGEIICCYLGGNNKQKLKLWGEWLCHQHSVGSGFQLRDAERLTAFKHEIKIWGMSLSQIQKLAESDTTKNPPSNFGTAPKRKIDPVAPTPKPLQIEDIEVGDIVRNTTVKNWSYVVLAKMENGMLDCQRNNTPVGTPEIRLALHPASVELVSKAATKVEPTEQPQHISIDINAVPVGVRLERTDDALITEYRVWAWAVVRVFGKPEVKQKCLGLLTEGKQGITARRPHGMSNPQSFQHTLDGIKYLMQGASLKLADLQAAYEQHQSEVAIAAIPAVTPEQARASLFGDVPVIADAFGGFSF